MIKRFLSSLLVFEHFYSVHAESNSNGADESHLTIVAHPIVTVTSSVDDRLRFQRLWSVYSSDHFNVQELLIGIPGPVYVEHKDDINDTAFEPFSNSFQVEKSLKTKYVYAQVWIQSSSHESLNFIRIDALHHKVVGLHLQLQNRHLKLNGYLLTRVVMSQAPNIQKLALSAINDYVVIGPKVLVSSDPEASITLVTNGIGNMFLNAPQESYVLHSFTLTSIGEGHMYVNIGSLEVSKRISMLNTGSGNTSLMVHNSIAAHEIYISSAAAGSTLLDVKGFLRVEELDIQSSGTGDVQILECTAAARCTSKHEKISIMSSGTVDVGSVRTNQADVYISGNGSAVVQTSKRLSATTLGSGKVYYVGDRPEEVVSRDESSLDPTDDQSLHEKTSQISFTLLTRLNWELPAEVPLLIQRDFLQSESLEVASAATEDRKENFDGASSTIKFSSKNSESPKSAHNYATGVAIAIVGSLIVVMFAARSHRRTRQRGRSSYIPIV